MDCDMDSNGNKASGGASEALCTFTLHMCVSLMINKEAICGSRRLGLRMLGPNDRPTLLLFFAAIADKITPEVSRAIVDLARSDPSLECTPSIQGPESRLRHARSCDGGAEFHGLFKEMVEKRGVPIF
eukprot:607210-Amphidinium_carterae.3